MQALRYQLSLPKYIVTRMFNSFRPKWIAPQTQRLRLLTHEPIPEIPGPRWVLLKVKLSGICGSDLNLLQGKESFSTEPYASFPAILGHETLASIEKLGSDVQGFRIGQRVVVHPALHCFVRQCPPCDFCKQGRTALCEHFTIKDELGQGMSLGYHRSLSGSWAEYLIAHETQIFSVPESMSDETAVLTDPMSTPIQGILDQPKEHFKQPLNVLILGAGTIGLLTLTAIRRLGLPWRVHSAYRHDFQGRLAKQLGADTIIKTSNQFESELEKVIRCRTIPISLGPATIEGGFDLIFDTVGSPETIDLALRWARARGTVQLLATSSSLRKVDPTPIWLREIGIRGTCMSHSVFDPRDKRHKPSYQLALELLNLAPLDELITHRFKLKDYQAGIQTALDKKRFQSVKVVFQAAR